MMAAPGMHPFWRVASVLLSFALGCAASVGVWMLRMPPCDNDCTAAPSVGLLVFLAIFPVVCTAVALGLPATGWPGRVQLGIVGAVLALAGVLAVCLG